MSTMEVSFYEKLLRATLSGRFDAITQVVSAHWNCPVSIIDIEYNILGMSPRVPIGDPTWDTLCQKSRVPDAMVLSFIEAQYMKEPSQTDQAVVINWGVAQENHRVNCRITTDHMVRGFISLVAKNVEWTQEDSREFELCAKCCSIIFQQRPQSAADVGFRRATFLSALLDGSISNHEILNRWLNGLDLSMGQYFWLMVIRSSQQNMLPTEREYIYRYLRSFFQGNALILKDQQACVLLTSNTPAFPQAKLVGIDPAIWRKFRLSAGVSRYYQDLIDSPAYFAQSQRALTFGLRFTPEETLFFYDKIALEDVLSCIPGQLPRANYEHSAIACLANHDEKQHTEYLRTLETYLCSFCDSGETALALHIHRNTLLYRLRQLQEIAHIDLSDPDTCILLLLNFRLARQERA